MTEAGPVLAMCLAFAKAPFPVKSGSCGTVVRNSEVKIVDNETGLSLTYNQPGEICIRGPQIMKGQQSLMLCSSCCMWVTLFVELVELSLSQHAGQCTYLKITDLKPNCKHFWITTI